MGDNLRTNLLYFGDNLDLLRKHDDFPSESVDLVYLDPPFNSSRNYNVLFKRTDLHESDAQIHAFEDTWAWDNEGRVQAVYSEFTLNAPVKVARLLEALVTAVGINDVTAYLVMMAPRLLELHRVLKPTGSLYLHCDPTASHYLKLMLDSIFEPQNFNNEIVWKRTYAHGDAGGQGARHYGRIHDVLLMYAKVAGRQTFNPAYQDYEAEYVESVFKHRDPDGRRWQSLPIDGPGGAAKGNPSYEVMGVTRYWRYSKAVMADLIAQGLIYQSKPGAVPRRKGYLDKSLGVLAQDIWADISKIASQADERLGYPTQKPLALLERIVAVSSNSGDVVLDPFCGCGTAVEAAHKLHRKWIGIDITPLATELVRRRMQKRFPGITIETPGWPKDMDGARALAALKDRYLFQDWAVFMLEGAPPAGQRKKGADKGIDGLIRFADGLGSSTTTMHIPISVKSGKTGAADVRNLLGVLSADAKHAIGVFVCLQPPTRQMTEAAVEAGMWESYDGKKFPRLQILSSQDILAGRKVQYPRGLAVDPFASAARGHSDPEEQGSLLP